MSEEVWKDVVGLEKFYRVSNRGEVASKNRDGKDGRRRLRGRVLRITTHNKTGQTQVCMSVDGVRYKKEVSAVVAEAFMGQTPAGMNVCHIDGNKQNNNLSNLEFLPIKEKVIKMMDTYCDRQPPSRITQKLLVERFEYNDGELIYRKRPGMKSLVGSIAGSKRVSGSILRVSGATIELRRAIYLYHHGQLPDYVIPIDGDNSNSRIENLKGLTGREWAIASERSKNLNGK